MVDKGRLQLDAIYRRLRAIHFPNSTHLHTRIHSLSLSHTHTHTHTYRLSTVFKNLRLCNFFCFSLSLSRQTGSHTLSLSLVIFERVCVCVCEWVSAFSQGWTPLCALWQRPCEPKEEIFLQKSDRKKTAPHIMSKLWRTIETYERYEIVKLQNQNHTEGQAYNQSRFTLQ